MPLISNPRFKTAYMNRNASLTFYFVLFGGTPNMPTTAQELETFLQQVAGWGNFSNLNGGAGVGNYACLGAITAALSVANLAPTFNLTGNLTLDIAPIANGTIKWAYIHSPSGGSSAWHTPGTYNLSQGYALSCGTSGSHPVILSTLSTTIAGPWPSVQNVNFSLV